MKSLVVLTLLFLFSCSLLSLPASSAQTKRKRNQPLPYGQTEGYEVFSSIIDARIKKLESQSVSIFNQTVSEESFRGVRLQCSDSFPKEFQTALEDFDKKAKTKFLLQREFSIQKKYRLVETMVGVQTGIYSMSAVGFDENKIHAIVLVQYLVRPAGSIILGGSKIFYLLRRTNKGWQQAADVQKCGQIY